MERVANKDCRRYVENREEFNGSNLFSRWHGNVYVVYSYGEHYPMFLWIDPERADGGWYENSDGYSVSTSKHHSQARPLNAEVIQHASTQDLKNLMFRYIVN